ncbi:hypothetical protein HDV01_000761 [Terramyces sp. JEL0728]|nr:hypothetical protein HDV01_000761 [Terramyces sp. JEL0728]
MVASNRSKNSKRHFCLYPDCHSTFSTSGHLARHMRVHTGEKSHGCLVPGCKSKFSRRDNMMQHYSSHLRKLGGCKVLELNRERKDRRYTAKAPETPGKNINDTPASADTLYDPYVSPTCSYSSIEDIFNPPTLQNNYSSNWPTPPLDLDLDIPQQSYSELPSFHFPAQMAPVEPILTSGSTNWHFQPIITERIYPTEWTFNF